MVCTQRPCWGNLGARSPCWRLTELDVWLRKRLWLGWAILQGQVSGSMSCGHWFWFAGRVRQL